MQTAFLHHFRSLLPSWKFFDQVGVIPTFAVRSVKEDGATEWINWSPLHPREFKTLFLNPQGNLELAKVSLLERVLTELGDNPVPEVFLNSVTYALLQAWAREEVVRLNSQTKYFQFKVSVRDQKATSPEAADVLISVEQEI